MVGMKKEKTIKIDVPAHILAIMEKLNESGHEAFVVGGCVRDLLLGTKPKDWDVATNARPEEVQGIFPDSVYENEFGTVGIKIRSGEVANGEGEQKKGDCFEVVEVTTFRIESKYSDKRHPDVVKFAKTLEEDLSRRDFTINALAMKVANWDNTHPTHSDAFFDGERELEIIDYFSGQNDLKNKLIRAVGDANERFSEDALRMMRAVRFSVTLGFAIEEKTFEAIKRNAENLKHISLERVRDEFVKIILSPVPARGIERLQETGILKIILPEIENSVGVMQSRHHYWGPYNTVYRHLVASLEKCPSEKLEVRLAALLHDVGKPKAKRGEGEDATFYNHEYIGERMTRNIFERLRFSRRVIDKVTLLVRNHMFYYNVDEVGESGVRRVVQKVGLENIGDLIDVRIADRLGSGVPKAVPYKLRHFQFMVEKVSHDPISVKQLKLNGNDLIKELGVEPGPKIGAILAVLLSNVIDDPTLNEKEKLITLAKELAKSQVEDLRKLAEEKIKKEQKKEEELIKRKHKVG